MFTIPSTASPFSNIIGCRTGVYGEGAVQSCVTYNHAPICHEK